jgi:hypothetical protein
LELRFSRKKSEILIYGENTVFVLDIDQFDGHPVSPFHSILIIIGRTETVVAFERNKFELATVWIDIHTWYRQKKGATVNHFLHIT